MLEKMETTQEINGEVAIVTASDKNVYIESLKAADIDVEVAAKIAKHNRAYVDAFATKATDVATEILEKNKDVNNVKVSAAFGSYKVGNSLVAADIHRSKTSRIVGTDKEVTKSAIRVSVTDSSLKPTKSIIGGLKDAMTAKFVN